MVPIGSVLAGKYRVDRVLGQGGMGVVVQAMHLQLGQPVAMKFLLPDVLSNPQVVERFLREAQAAVRLKSEHVARVIDVGTLDNGAPYMVLEYLDGLDLAHFPRTQLTVGLIIDLILQACEALAEAHALGIVHRDIKPANFFVTTRSDGSYLTKLLDFGISKAKSGPTDRNLTSTQMVMGTPTYMSPEQMKASRDVDQRSDIWSLGVVLYELLQGTPPYESEAFSAMIIKVVTEPLPPMKVALPPGLADIVYRCLNKEAAYRFQNVAELANALAPYAFSTVQAAVTVERTSRVLGTNPPRRTPDTHPGIPARPTTLSSSTGAITQPPAGKKKWPLFAGLGAALLAVIVIVGVAANGGPGSNNATATKSNEPARTAAEPAKTEPAKTEPAKTEPAKAEPAKTEPAKTEPAKTVAEPVKTEPAKTEPATTVQTEPAKTEPAKTESAKTEPAKTEPAKTVATQPAKPPKTTTQSSTSKHTQTSKPATTTTKPPDDILGTRN